MLGRDSRGRRVRGGRRHLQSEVVGQYDDDDDGGGRKGRRGGTFFVRVEYIEVSVAQRELVGDGRLLVALLA